MRPVCYIPQLIAAVASAIILIIGPTVVPRWILLAFCVFSYASFIIFAISFVRWAIREHKRYKAIK